MMQVVTITSQGQITIPAVFRRALGLKKEQKALISLEKDIISIKPRVDFMSYAGSLNKYALKNRNIDEIIRMEEEAVEKAFSGRHKKS